MTKKTELKIQFPEGMTLGNDPVPVAPALSSDYFAKEAERIFRRVWLNVARVEEVAEPGQYVVRNLPNIKASVLIIRGKDGELRAFHNVCTHRGNRLVDGCAGRGNRLMCGYHGWTFDSNGMLIGVPDQHQFPGLDKSTLGLKPVSVDSWNGFVFINMQAQPDEDLVTFLGDLADVFMDYPFLEMQRLGSYRSRVQANWKVCMDIGSEAYHVPFVHKMSVPDSHISDETKLANRLAVYIHDRHRRTSLAANPKHKLSPAEAVVARHAPTVIQGYEEGALPACLNPEKIENWGFDTNIFFPNFGLLLGPNWFVTHLYWPVSVNETAWETTLYALPAKSVGERLSQEYSAVLTRDLIREDWAQVERTQAGLETGALTHVHLSNQEVMVRHAYSVVDRYVNAA